MSKEIKIQLAREFRKNPTKEEKIMWRILRRNGLLGLNFRRQHVIEGYIVDFYCHKLKLVLEIDGPIHNLQIKNDKIRQEIIENKGIRFYRIKNEDIENNLKEVLEKLIIFIEEY